VVDVGPTTELLVEQGYEMERPSNIVVRVHSEDEVIQTVKVGVQCVMVVEGSLSF
jgi:trans-2,3-dihydro-3-hydroxyanthranilate isomerase